MAKIQYIECWDYVCAIYRAKYDIGTNKIISKIFLGTGFFVTNNGIALTAAHVIPESTEPDEFIVCAFQSEGKQVMCFKEFHTKFEKFDCAMVKFSDARSKYFTIDVSSITMGTDVEVLGIPQHETGDPGLKQMRILKGHVVLSEKSKLELNFMVPAGMSGSPLLRGDRIVGLATGRLSSEEIEDHYEEVERVTNDKEVITISTVKRLTYYGVAIPFSALATVPLTKDNPETFLDIINTWNNSSDSLIVPRDHDS
jgi:hypothetical protein